MALYNWVIQISITVLILRYVFMRKSNKALNKILIIIGTLSILIGLIGIILPILPTTPFLLLAAVCYGKSSKKLYDYLLNNPLLGEYISNYIKGKGIPFHTKLFALALLWLSIGYAALFAVQSVIVKILLFIIASGVTIHLIKIKTLRKEPEDKSNLDNDNIDKSIIYNKES